MLGSCVQPHNIFLYHFIIKDWCDIKSR